MNEMGPNVRRLFVIRMSRDVIPDGGGIMDGISFFTDMSKRKAIMENAEEWVYRAISAVRNASDPNPFKDSSDEEVASEILKKYDSE